MSSGGVGSVGRCQATDWMELSRPLLFSAGFCESRQLQEGRFSAVAIEMLREQEDRDLHPYGRGGRFEGVLYSRRVKVQVDHAKFLAWIVFAGFILLTSGAIIFLAEMERRQKSQALAAAATPGAPALLLTMRLNASSGAPGN